MVADSSTFLLTVNFKPGVLRHALALHSIKDDSGTLPRLMSEVVMASHDLAHPATLTSDLRPLTSNSQPDLAPTKYIHAHPTYRWIVK
ncbi:unnamed protein product [Danaus chrysippus]|uniref:(African queen) hypothetical protein n=1 Tax=Danaus chrysippus TaxID=151541 RepID=A0A8J2QKT6_9NEOP|nr:unnamed protein product [Danaus chrysippus]